MTVLTAQAVQESKDSGTTIKEIIRSLFGDSRHRMVERLFDVLPSYQLKGDALEHLNPFPEEDESTGIMRTCESEGKIKFYRFYMRDNYPQELKLKPAKKKRPINQVFKDGDLNKVEKRLRGKLNDRGKGPLVEVPKRLGSANILLHPERGETLPEVVEKPVEKATTPKVKKPRLGSLNKPQTKLVEKKTKRENYQTNWRIRILLKEMIYYHELKELPENHLLLLMMIMMMTRWWKKKKKRTLT